MFFDIGKPHISTYMRSRSSWQLGGIVWLHASRLGPIPSSCGWQIAFFHYVTSAHCYSAASEADV